MRLAELSRDEISLALRQQNGFGIIMQPFVVRVHSDIPSLADDLLCLYADFPVAPAKGFADFHVAVLRERGLRRWFGPLARFYFDGRPSFIPLPVHQALPMLEWGLNWCIAAHGHTFLIIHAAVIARNGEAIVLPAPPGSGKSTLCAALVNRGWRLLSDELALYDMATGEIYGMARPVNLKNHSIDVVRQHTPDVVITRPVPDTTKGTVALMKPPADSVAAVGSPVRATRIVLPRFEAGADAVLEPWSRAETFMLIADQSFNYNVHGRAGFEAVGDLVSSCRCYRFTYSALADAERVFESFAAGVM